MKSWKHIVGALILALASPLTSPLVAHASPVSGADRFVEAPGGTVDASLVAGSRSSEPVKVIVELADDPVAVVEAKAGRGLAPDEKARIREKLKGRQGAVGDRTRASGGTVLAEMQDAYNGIKVQVPGTDVAGLARAPGVKAVHPVEIHGAATAGSVPYLGVPHVWESTGFTGEGVKIAIIDTGVDYTHAAFGGPGTPEAFLAANAVSTLPADGALFGPEAPRVRGGYDLVGDAFDANRPGSVPQPDPNPLDCAAHGTHVAGIAAGGGVTAEGASYTGPYDSATADLPWRIGPGVAPEAEIYAYRVFGCTGATDVTAEAIDMAVRDGVHVINLSLSSASGTTSSPSAVAAANAVGAGVVVVASAGNTGPNPYLTGSPGTGRGVLSVAANDPASSDFSPVSAGGPRTGDSGVKPSVTAPGVGISSALVSTGNGAVTLSGTSMAAPHVAGVAALNVQAHPSWGPGAIAANLVNTADPSKVGDYRLTLGGTGQVDAAGSVANQVTATGDRYLSTSGVVAEPSLSFGFAESTTRFSRTRKITLTNHGTRDQRFTVTTPAAPQSRPAKVKVSRSSVTVPARGKASVSVTVTVPMGSVGSALAGGLAFHEASGHVVFKGRSELRVPWLVVPRAQADVTATLDGKPSQHTSAARHASHRPTLDISLSNRAGALRAKADVYQLGMTDPQGDAATGAAGTDLRALGIQSHDLGRGDKLLVFAVNSWNRFSNAAQHQTQVDVHVDDDDVADYTVVAADSGLLRSGQANGRPEVFVYDVAAQAVTPAGFYAVAPTDNSTILLPVRASSLGLTPASGSFGYSGATYSAASARSDAFDGLARYDAWTPAIENGISVDVPTGRAKVKVRAKVSPKAVADQQPEGLMVVVLDNAAGAPEAILLPRR